MEQAHREVVAQEQAGALAEEERLEAEEEERGLVQALAVCASALPAERRPPMKEVPLAAL